MDSKSNSTVLGVASMSRTLPAVAAVLVVLFVAIRPEATAGFSFLERVVFWGVHIGMGLASILLASRLLRPALGRAMPLPAAIVLTGLAGSAMLAPVFVGLEALLPKDLVDEPDGWLDAFAAGGIPQAVLVEFLEVTPMFLAAWFAVNLPLMLARPEIGDPPPEQPQGPDDGGHADRDNATTDTPDEPSEQFFALIPRALGRDIVAISSDMHYLHIHTSLGKCMVLGTLRDATDVLGDTGMLVHRSHWVAHEHVRKIARKGSSWECVMSNELRIPVSRRNRTRVTDWYGSAGNIVSIGSRKAG